jgi:very-short-patch-repair endonuclease
LTVTVHRQKVFGTFIVDFYCASAILVIEIDGSQHFEKNGIEKDAVRDESLRDLGLTVKRYSNFEISNHFDDVCAEIYHYIFPNER